MYTNDHSSHSFSVGLLCGAAIGAAVGLLLAPKSGAELRNTIAGSATRLRKTFNDRYDDAAGMVGRVVEDGREAVRRGREAFDRTRNDYAEEATGRVDG
jgi:gas vesicle protein